MGKYTRNYVNALKEAAVPHLAETVGRNKEPRGPNWNAFKQSIPRLSVEMVPLKRNFKSILSIPDYLRKGRGNGEVQSGK